MNTQTESTQFQRGIEGDFLLRIKDIEFLQNLSDVGYPVSGDRLAKITRH